jgi:hypothetical protein
MYSVLMIIVYNTVLNIQNLLREYILCSHHKKCEAVYAN